MVSDKNQTMEPTVAKYSIDSMAPDMQPENFPRVAFFVVIGIDRCVVRRRSQNTRFDSIRFRGTSREGICTSGERKRRRELRKDERDSDVHK